MRVGRCREPADVVAVSAMQRQVNGEAELPRRENHVPRVGQFPGERDRPSARDHRAAERRVESRRQGVDVAEAVGEGPPSR